VIDNSLKKDLEVVQKRKLLNAKSKAKYNDAKEVFNSFQIIAYS
jgi:hypothetical protein